MQKVRNVTLFSPKPPNGRFHLINSGTLRRKILNWMLKKLGRREYMGFMWLRT
jgi:hypothetical protein